MPSQKATKVIIDTNIWISFLIGKLLGDLKGWIIHKKVEIIITDQLLEEISIVTKRPKFKKYFPPRKVKELVKLLDLVCLNVPVENKDQGFEDPKDNFLLTLSETSKAAYLITGDSKLIALGNFKGTKILTAKEFEQMINQDNDG